MTKFFKIWKKKIFVLVLPILGQKINSKYHCAKFKKDGRTDGQG